MSASRVGQVWSCDGTIELIVASDKHGTHSTVLLDRAETVTVFHVHETTLLTAERHEDDSDTPWWRRIA